MTKAEAIARYKTQTELARVLGLSQSTVAEWGEYPPAIQQLRIERLTRGKLRAESHLLSPKKKRAA